MMRICTVGIVVDVWSCVKFYVHLAVCSVLFLAICPDVSLAKWIIEGNDQCVWVWTPTALIRGPVALANVPTIPIRTITGMWVGIGRKEGMVEGGKQALLLGPLFSLGFVAVETLWAIAETVTGGYFPVLTEDEAQMYKKPLIPPLDAAVHDACGRLRPTANDVKAAVSDFRICPDAAIQGGETESAGLREFFCTVIVAEPFKPRITRRRFLQDRWTPLRSNRPLEPTAVCAGWWD